MKRMWINQPSKLQLLHKLHGTNVLVDQAHRNDGKYVLYFLNGDVISMVVDPVVLSTGWVEQKGQS